MLIGQALQARPERCCLLRQHPQALDKLRTHWVRYMYAVTGVVYASTQTNPRALVKCEMWHKAKDRASNRPGK